MNAPVEFRDPRRVIEARDVSGVGAAMVEVERALAAGHHVAGFVAYEAARAFDPALETQPPTGVPLVWFGVFDAPVEVPAIDEVVAPPAPDVVWTSAIAPEAYRAGIAAIRRAIADGVTYQTNYTFRLRANVLPETAWPLYVALSRAERPPYAAFVETGEWTLLSLSPELFFRTGDGRIDTEPMKGTAPRGRFLAEDDERAAALSASEKNRAENVMIVDLARNDVGRIAEIGSVRPAFLYHVDRYPSVLQMVSRVTARLRPETTLRDVFAALFPAGSITGAPKTSSMRAIAALEHAPRGAYCGAIGYASPDGSAVFNVAIRTATIRAATGEAEYGVGGGITWDSDAGDEYAEALSKAACLRLRPEFSLVETVRLEEGCAVRANGHLARMARSAAYFGFPFDEQAARVLLQREADAHLKTPRRARLLLARDGRLRVESRDLDPTPASPRYAVAASPIDARDRFLFHKTSMRALYEKHAADHPEAFDVLLWNEQGELTEFTRGNVVVSLDGVDLTPPVTCGLLEGVYREELLRNGAVIERAITRDDLARASAVWFVNSLRGRIPLTPVSRESSTRSRVRDDVSR